MQKGINIENSRSIEKWPIRQVITYETRTGIVFVFQIQPTLRMWSSGTSCTLLMITISMDDHGCLTFGV